MGDPQAISKARAFGAYVDKVTANVTRNVSTVPMSKRPRVLHISNLSPLTVDGKGSMMDSWIKVAGGVNVAASVSQAGYQVSPEQIMAWNPDIIIIGSVSKGVSPADIMNNPAFKSVKAVQTKRVYINPKGMFFWDRYSAEAILQVQWAAQKFYPTKFRSFDVVKETESFYKTFFNYPLTPQEAEMIIAGVPPKQ